MITPYLAQPQLVTDFLFIAYDHPVLDTKLLLMTTTSNKVFPTVSDYAFRLFVKPYQVWKILGSH